MMLPYKIKKGAIVSLRMSNGQATDGQVPLLAQRHYFDRVAIEKLYRQVDNQS